MQLLASGALKVSRHRWRMAPLYPIVAIGIEACFATNTNLSTSPLGGNWMILWPGLSPTRAEWQSDASHGPDGKKASMRTLKCNIGCAYRFMRNVSLPGIEPFKTTTGVWRLFPMAFRNIEHARINHQHNPILLYIVVTKKGATFIFYNF